jgi:Rab proteins geranylgeranyltransferase component A
MSCRLKSSSLTICIEEDSPSSNVFGGAKLEITSFDGDEGSPLSFSRAYSLALAPQLIYTDSELLKILVSSKVYRQLDFLAMGSWWIYARDTAAPEGKLIRVPTSREDVAFADSAIDLRSKRLLMKVLRFVMEYEEQSELWEEFRKRPFTEFLVQRFKLTPLLMDLFTGLSLSTFSAEDTATEFALPRVARHLRSIGRLGPGFSSIIPKWGGLSEIAQVSCRAGAVGGAVYMLGTGITQINRSNDESDSEINESTVQLSNGNIVKSKIVIGSEEAITPEITQRRSQPSSCERISHSISMVSSSLAGLVPVPSEGEPSPAGSVVIFPPGSIDSSMNPVYLFIHSSDTGECPKGQCKSFSCANTTFVI